MLGEAISMLVPQVVGFKLTGRLPEGATATDLVLTVTQILRATGVVGKFVEYFGHGLAGAAARRPRDDREHVAGVRRDVRLLPGRRARRSSTCASPAARDERIALVEAYCKENGLWHDAGRASRRTRRSSSSTSRPSSRRSPGRAGRRTACRSRREAVVPRGARRRFGVELRGTDARPGGRGHVPRERPDRPSSAPGDAAVRAEPHVEPGRGRRTRRAGRGRARRRAYELTHGAVVIAAITSCTNTSNPSVMVGAGLLAKKAVERGLSASPGSSPRSRPARRS